VAAVCKQVGPPVLVVALLYTCLVYSWWLGHTCTSHIHTPCTDVHACCVVCRAGRACGWSSYKHFPYILIYICVVYTCASLCPWWCVLLFLATSLEQTERVSLCGIGLVAQAARLCQQHAAVAEGVSV
jgi:hypothetical protein